MARKQGGKKKERITMTTLISALGAHLFVDVSWELDLLHQFETC